MNLQKSFLILSVIFAIGFAAFTNYEDGCGNQIRYRKNWRTLSESEKQLYLRAVVALKQRTATPTYDQFVEAHQHAATYAHFTPWFYYWHRWFVWRYETVLRWVAKNDLGLPQSQVCSIAAHYWASERDADFTVTRVAPAPFTSTTFGSFSTREQCGIPNGVFSSSWFKVVYPLDGCQSISRDISTRFGLPLETSLAQTFANNANFRQMWTNMENGPHGAVHNFIGGQMATMTSTDDPIFFVHHANVDRWLSLWIDMWNYDQTDIDDLATPVQYTPPTTTEQRRIQVEGDVQVSQTVPSGIDDCMTYTDNPTGLFTDAANPSNCATPRRMVSIGNSVSSRGFGGMYYRYETPDNLVDVINSKYPQFKSNWHWFPLSGSKKRADDGENSTSVDGALSDNDTDNVITKRAISDTDLPIGNFSCKSANVLYQLAQSEYGGTQSAAQVLRALEYKECQLYQQQLYITREWVLNHGMDPDSPDFVFPVPICQVASSVEALLGVSSPDAGTYYVAYSTGLIAGLSILIVILVIIAIVFGILLYQENKKINISSASIL